LVTRERWIAVAFVVAVVSMIALLVILAGVALGTSGRRVSLRRRRLASEG